MKNLRRKPTNQELLDRIAIMESQITRLSTSHNGYLTRPALDIMLESIDDRLYDTESKLVFVGWDVDDMKGSNKANGEPETNRRLVAARQSMRSVDMGTVWSGDEYMAVVEDCDAIGFANRMQDALHANQLSATFVIVNPRNYSNYDDAIDAQRNFCTVHKNAGERNAIHDHR